MDAGKIEAAITDRTRAILPVEVFGSPVGFDEICRLAAKHNLAVIEDSCEALGSELRGKKAGSFGTMSVFGFYPNKQITTGEGGMILTDDDGLADTCVSLRNQGRGKSGGWLGHERLGYNLSLIHISEPTRRRGISRIGQIKAKRRQVAKWYQELLGEDERLIVPAEPADCQISWFVLVVRLAKRFGKEQRDAVLKAMQQAGIGVSNYFPPVHLQPFMVERFDYRKGDFPITEGVCERTMALPFHNNLSKDEVGTVYETLRRCLDKI